MTLNKKSTFLTALFLSFSIPSFSFAMDNDKNQQDSNNPSSTPTIKEKDDIDSETEKNLFETLDNLYPSPSANNDLLTPEFENEKLIPHNPKKEEKALKKELKSEKTGNYDTDSDSDFE